MKKIITFACLLAGLSSFGQLKVFPKKTKPLPDFLKTGKFVNNTDRIFHPQAKLLSQTAAGKVYALPQDKMPAFVPNINLVRPIPNRGMQGFQYSLMIPNPYTKGDINPAQ